MRSMLFSTQQPGTRKRACWVIPLLAQGRAWHHLCPSSTRIFNKNVHKVAVLRMSPAHMLTTTSSTTTSTSGTKVAMQREDRAQFVRACAAAAIGLANALTATPATATTPTHVVNSVLSAYGIPMMTEKGDFASLYIQLPDDGGQRTLCAFSYPRSWVETTKRDGLVSAANYQTGDGLTLNVAEAPGKASSIGGVSAIAVVAEATPSQGAVQIIQELPASKGGVDYKYLIVKYNIVTRSGYDVERIAYIAATVRQRKLFSLSATVSSERRKKMGVDLDAIRSSFRVGELGASEETPVGSV